MLPRPPSARCTGERTTGPHNYVEVIAAFKWRLDHCHAAGGAYGNSFSRPDHDRIADFAYCETPLVILIPRIGSHAIKISNLVCGAIRTCAMQKNVPLV